MYKLAAKECTFAGKKRGYAQSEERGCREEASLGEVAQ